MSVQVSDILIIGGGILGLSCAWSIASSAPIGSRITLLESNTLSSGTTSQAAALLTRARPNQDMARLVAATFKAISKLEAELNESLPLRKVGSLHISMGHESADYLTSTETAARLFDLRHHRVNPKQVKQLSPWLNTQKIDNALLVEDDGYMDPVQLSQAYAAAARKKGVQIKQGVTIKDLFVASQGIQGVLTNQGIFEAPQVICCAGPWSIKLLHDYEVRLGMAAVRSHYWITDVNPALFPTHAPMVIMPDIKAYARPEVGGLLFGLRDQQAVYASPDQQAVYASPDQIPASIHGFEFDQDPKGLECLEDQWQGLSDLFPSLNDIGIAHYISGISSYTPDGKPIIDATSISGLYVATGCSGGGIAISGGVGEAMANLVLNKTTAGSLETFSINRFGAIDPLDQAFMVECAQARSQKKSG
ncbi:hypothetical protein DN062_02185 [Nitrincola tibetensis]|uniref:FAD dependent oxidoreductase domain-containing protein n=1 Tax=Nitrincola tibetensis TaxID=2219697 RepID=A0A364NS32_9GAMM|nr:FAD-dependent oxidoreductase [Nitrincola tibetensis]RAU19903.1 hypothetical protein DN062_02185 [Nitrincola tibetensis]